MKNHAAKPGHNILNYRSNYVAEIENISANDAITAIRFMEVELTCYNHLVNIFSAQFNRDYTFFTSLTPEMVQLFGQLCYRPTDIYNIKNIDDADLSKNLNKDTIKKMNSTTRYLFTEAARAYDIIPDIRRRMGMSILDFYIMQSSIRSNHKKVSDFGIESSVPYNNLTPQTSFNKKHLQINRKSCIVSKSDGKVNITVPYLKKPIVINDSDDYISRNWNYLILHQQDQITSTKSKWVIDLKVVKNDTYYIKYLDRLGRSSIFEMAKRLY